MDYLSRWPTNYRAFPMKSKCFGHFWWKFFQNHFCDWHRKKPGLSLIFGFDWRNNQQSHQMWLMPHYSLLHCGGGGDGGLTRIFSPLQDGSHLVPLLRLADTIASCCANSDGVQVGFHPTQICCACGCTVWNLEVHAVGLHGTRTHKHTQIWVTKYTVKELEFNL